MARERKREREKKRKKDQLNPAAIFLCSGARTTLVFFMTMYFNQSSSVDGDYLLRTEGCRQFDSLQLDQGCFLFS